MKHRFIGNFKLKPGRFSVSDIEIIHQVWDVLKLRPDEEIILCDGQGNEALAKILERDSGGIEVELAEILKNSAEPSRKVALYCAILKKENFELVCQKATESGATEIIPVSTDRTVKLNLRSDRLEKIIREAAEQSGRGVLPRLNHIIDFEKSISDSARYASRVMFDPFGQKFEGKLSSGDIAIFIGPEGGWTPEEVQMARDSGFNIISLGPRILRGETAAVIATFLAAL